jgi:hypothetical protein
MTKTIITFLCLQIVFTISTSRAFCSDAGGVYSTSDPAEVVAPVRNSAVDDQLSGLHEGASDDLQPGDLEKDIRKYTPPSLPRKIARWTIIAPAKWVVGMPVVAANVAHAETKYGINGEWAEGEQEFSEHRRHPRLWALGAIGRLPFAMVDGFAVAPVFAGEHAWDSRPLSKLDL